MLKIRMQRTGRANMPTYRIVVAEHTTSPKSGRFVERLGSYNPKSKERTLKSERIAYWLSVGAQPSGTVHNMLVSVGLLQAKKVNVLPKKTPPKKEQEEAAAPAPSAQTSADAPAEEKSEGEAAADDAAAEESAAA